MYHSRRQLLSLRRLLPLTPLQTENKKFDSRAGFMPDEDGFAFSAAPANFVPFLNCGCFGLSNHVTARAQFAERRESARLELVMVVLGAHHRLCFTSVLESSRLPATGQKKFILTRDFS